jgi:hypothetical protein
VCECAAGAMVCVIACLSQELGRVLGQYARTHMPGQLERRASGVTHMCYIAGVTWVVEAHCGCTMLVTCSTQRFTCSATLAHTPAYKRCITLASQRPISQGLTRSTGGWSQQQAWHRKTLLAQRHQTSAVSQQPLLNPYKYSCPLSCRQLREPIVLPTAAPQCHSVQWTYATFTTMMYISKYRPAAHGR